MKQISNGEANREQVKLEKYSSPDRTPNTMSIKKTNFERYDILNLKRMEQLQFLRKCSSLLLVIENIQTFFHVTFRQ